MKKVLPLVLLATIAMTGSAAAAAGDSLTQVSKSSTLANSKVHALNSAERVSIEAAPSTYVGTSGFLTSGVYNRYMSLSGTSKGYQFRTTTGNVLLELQMESSLASAVFQVFDGYGVAPIFQGTTSVPDSYIGVSGTLMPNTVYYVQVTPSYYGSYAYYYLGGTF